MYKKEYPPLLENGFKEIALWQLDIVFLEPFGENQQRKYLINRLRAFIHEFQALNLTSELWIDGSFSTEKPEPQDIDLVFLMDRKLVSSLKGKKAELFNILFNEREKIKARYSLDIYFIDIEDEDQRNQWIETYGFDFKKLNTKGIYKIII